MRSAGATAGATARPGIRNVKQGGNHSNINKNKNIEEKIIKSVENLNVCIMAHHPSKEVLLAPRLLFGNEIKVDLPLSGVNFAVLTCVYIVVQA